jgi:hypothetical protein
MRIVPAGFVFAPGDALAPEAGPGVLTTLTQPPGLGSLEISASYARMATGMAAVFDGNGPIYTLPLPEDAGKAVYKSSPKQQYVWRSKKFVMPGQTTMGAAKVVHDGQGLRFQLHMDNCCVFQTIVRDCDPFRLPDQLRGIMWEIVLIGCARVTEVIVAPTMRELSSE